MATTPEQRQQDRVRRARLDHLMAELALEGLDVRGVLGVIVARLGWDRCRELLDEVREIEAAGGIWSAETRQPRTKSDVFFLRLSRYGWVRRLLKLHARPKLAAPAPEHVELRYRWVEPGMFHNPAGEQLHENDIPDVQGRTVRFVYVVEDLKHDHVDAAAQIREWLLACGATGVEMEAAES